MIFVVFGKMIHSMERSRLYAETSMCVGDRVYLDGDQIMSAIDAVIHRPRLDADMSLCASDHEFVFEAITSYLQSTPSSTDQGPAPSHHKHCTELLHQEQSDIALSIRCDASSVQQPQNTNSIVHLTIQPTLRGHHDA